MKRLCGKKGSPAIERALVLAMGTAAFVLLASAGPAVAAQPPKQPPRPQPQNLWKAYPLDASSGGTVGSPAHVRERAHTSMSTRSSGSKSTSFLLWGSLVAFGAALVVFAISWRANLACVRSAARRVQRRVRSSPAQEGSVLAVPANGVRATLSVHTAQIARPAARRLHALKIALHESIASRASQHGDVDTDSHPPTGPSGSPEDAATRERTLLKRKRAAATSKAVERLKAKSADTREDREREIGVLKAKLAEPQPPDLHGKETDEQRPREGAPSHAGAGARHHGRAAGGGLGA